MQMALKKALFPLMLVVALFVIWRLPQPTTAHLGVFKITAEDCADRGGRMQVAGGGLFPHHSVCLMPDGDTINIYVPRKSQ